MKSSQDRFLRLIAVFKFFKGTMLIALSVGVFRLLHKDVGEVAERWVQALRLNPGNHFVEAVLIKASLLTPAQIKKLGLGSLIYAGLFFTEGVGLWLLKPWAEWFTAILTATLIPLEVYEINRRPTAARVVVLLMNVAIVFYLVRCIRNRKKGQTPGAV
jgi:uncharacterized membrane protein (DUF2068 family)